MVIVFNKRKVLFLKVSLLIQRLLLYKLYYIFEKEITHLHFFRKRGIMNEEKCLL